jgi:hypothetical protein
LFKGAHMLALAKLASMSADERARAVSGLAPNGVGVDAEIRLLEQRYEMSSETMRARVARGEIDTADTARWLVLLAARGR